MSAAYLLRDRHSPDNLQTQLNPAVPDHEDRLTWDDLRLEGII